MSTQAVTERADRRAAVIEAARAWNVARQRFETARHSGDVNVLTPLHRGLLAAEDQLAAAIEELDR